MSAADYYAAACADAATRQGIDPIVAALTTAGIPVDVEQTGGFTMVATVTCADGVIAIINDGAFYVGAYPGNAWHDGESGTDGETVLEHDEIAELADVVDGYADRFGGVK